MLYACGGRRGAHRQYRLGMKALFISAQHLGVYQHPDVLSHKVSLMPQSQTEVCLVSRSWGSHGPR